MRKFNGMEAIEAECRAVQYSRGPQTAKDWWDRNFAHKYSDYVYDVEKERVVRRDDR